MGGGSERERELLGEMISNKMPVFRNIGPLATAFGWLFLPPNYILIKYCLSFDSSTKKSTFKVPAVISGWRVLGCRHRRTSTLVCPASWDSCGVSTGSSGAGDAKRALVMIWAILSGQGSWIGSSVPQCWELPAAVPLGIPRMQSLCAPTAEPFTSVLGWVNGLMGAFKFFTWELELWSLIPNINFWFISAIFSLGKVSSAKGSKSPGVFLCPWLQFVCEKRTWPCARTVRLSWQTFLLVTANKYITPHISSLRRV